MKYPDKRVYGVTGGVGSGKSTVLALLHEKYGAEILEADRIAEELMQPGQTVYEEVRKLFGPSVLCPDASFDRKAIAEIIFREPEKRERLNALVHPGTRAEVVRRIRESRSSLVIYEAALPREACFDELCDALIYVFAPKKVRMERLRKGRGYSNKKTESIMAGQLSYREFRAISDVTVDNGKSPEETEKSLAEALAYLSEREAAL